MAEHRVIVDIPQKVVLSKDVRFTVRSDGEKIGELLISKGNLEWFPASNRVNKYRLSWEAFDRLMTESGRKVKVTR